jgi:uncharacterized protein
MTAKDWIAKLKLKAHPEGGFYTETYRSRLVLKKECIPSVFDGTRNIATAIYYLLGADDFSAFHRIPSDEMWHHYEGGNLRIVCISPDGEREDLLLGKEGDALPQVWVPANWWFGAFVESGEFVLAGCTVTPGFHFHDFDMGIKYDLLNKFPQHAEVIHRLIHSN